MASDKGMKRAGLGVEDTLRYMMTNNYITDEGLKWMDLMSEKYMEQDDE